MRSVVIFVLLILAGLPDAHARLGENEAELVKRFGAPRSRSQHFIAAQGKILPLGPALFFRQEDWLIQADLVDGRCVRIHYAKPGEWVEEQFKTLLDANAQGARWTDVSKKLSVKLARDWKRSDGGTAQWKAGVGARIDSPDYHRAVETAKASARADATRKPNI